MQEANGKMEFFYQFNDQEGSVLMTLHPGSSLPKVLEAFETFLRAAGYVFDGQVDIIDSYIPTDPNAEQN